jgi:hypothetical protein
VALSRFEIGTREKGKNDSFGNHDPCDLTGKSKEKKKENRRNYPPVFF